jgi:hypothetical protein
MFCGGVPGPPPRALPLNSGLDYQLFPNEVELQCLGERGGRSARRMW